MTFIVLSNKKKVCVIVVLLDHFRITAKINECLVCLPFHKMVYLLPLMHLFCEVGHFCIRDLLLVVDSDNAS